MQEYAYAVTILKHIIIFFFILFSMIFGFSGMS